MRYSTKILVVLSCFFLNGCIAALPAAIIALRAVSLGGGAVLAGYGGTNALIDYHKNKLDQAKQQYPIIDFDKQWPNCLIFNIDYDKAFLITRQVINGLKGNIEKEEKGPGLIETKKSLIEMPQSKGPVEFYQREIYKITKHGEQSTEVCVKYVFSTTVNGQNNEYDDPEGANLFKAIFFTKFTELLADMDKGNSQ